MKKVLKKTIKFLNEKDIKLSATEIADVLWLYSIMEKENKVLKDEEEKKSKTSDETLNKDDENIDNTTNSDDISEDKDLSSLHRKETESVTDKGTSKGSHFSVPTRKHYNHFNQFSTVLKILREFHNSSSIYEFDEIETIEYIVNTGIFNIIEKPKKELKYTLYIIIEVSTSMSIWDELNHEFISALSRFSFFKKVNVLYLKEGKNKYRLFTDKECHKKSSIKIFDSFEKRNLTMLLTDCVSMGWRDNRGYKFLNKITKSTPFMIVNMLPQRMWVRTTLHKTWRVNFTHKTNWNNKTLVSDIDNSLNRDEKKINFGKHLRIPMTTLDTLPFKHWANLVSGKRNNFLNGSIFEAKVFKEENSINLPTTDTFEAEELVNAFYSYSSPMAQKLMIYFSAVDLNMEIMKMVQRTSLPMSNHTHLAEVFLSGLLKRNDKDKNIFDFKKDIREILLDRLYPYKIKEIQEKNKEFILKNIGCMNDFSALIKNPDSIGEVDILEMSKSFAKGMEDSRLKEEKSIIKNEIIIYSEKDLNVSLIDIVNYLNRICNYLTFKTGESTFELKDNIVDFSKSYNSLSQSIHDETKDSFASFFFTKKQYNNNYFFEGNTNFDNLMIVSFFSWKSLTTLSYSNSIAYFIAEVISFKLSKFQHQDSTGCLYDFSSNKSDIDKNMREAYICKSCYERISSNKTKENIKILEDIESILKVVGEASKKDLDIFAKGHEIEVSVVVQLEKKGWEKSNIIQEYKLPNGHKADLLLRHQDKDLAIIEIKATTNEPKSGLEQAINYGKQLNIDYVYATNGLEIYEYSIDKQKGNFIDKYPSPEELYQKYNNEPTYWHLQLHPHDSSYTIEQVKEILSRNLIGLDFGENDGYHENSSLENWYKNTDDRKKYFLKIVKNDIVLIRHGAKPIALVKAISGYKYVESPITPIWFKHQIEVEVLSYYDEYIKKYLVKPFSIPQIRGTLWKSKNANTDTYQIIDNWYKTIQIKPKQQEILSREVKEKNDITLSCDEVIKYTVQVQYKENMGSGFIVKVDKFSNNFFVITAKHIFTKNLMSTNINLDRDEIVINYKNKTIVPQQIIILESDMVAFVCDSSVTNTIDNLKTIPLASSPNQFKESIFSGYSRNNLICQRCTYSHRLLEENLYQIKSDYTYHSNDMLGLSGSGLFIKENGQYSIVGMIVQIVERVSAFNYIDLAPLMDEILSKVDVLLIETGKTHNEDEDFFVLFKEFLDVYNKALNSEEDFQIYAQNCVLKSWNLIELFAQKIIQLNNEEVSTRKKDAFHIVKQLTRDNNPYLNEKVRKNIDYKFNKIRTIRNEVAHNKSIVNKVKLEEIKKDLVYLADFLDDYKDNLQSSLKEQKEFMNIRDIQNPKELFYKDLNNIKKFLKFFSTIHQYNILEKINNLEDIVDDLYYRVSAYDFGFIDFILSKVNMIEYSNILIENDDKKKLINPRNILIEEIRKTNEFLISLYKHLSYEEDYLKNVKKLKYKEGHFIKEIKKIMLSTDELISLIQNMNLEELSALLNRSNIIDKTDKALTPIEEVVNYLKKNRNYIIISILKKLENNNMIYMEKLKEKKIEFIESINKHFDWMIELLHELDDKKNSIDNLSIIDSLYPAYCDFYQEFTLSLVNIEENIEVKKILKGLSTALSNKYKCD